MEVKKLLEAGYEQAALGFSLSYNSTPERAKQILAKFAYGKPGESKFLEHIQVWLLVDAPRYWWAEAATYRVGNSAQSESTLHTITKRFLTIDDFEGGALPYGTLSRLNWLISEYKKQTEAEEKRKLFYSIKRELPESFLQTREWNLNYRVLQNIWMQRKDHRLEEWQIFLKSVLKQIEHPEFIVR